MGRPSRIRMQIGLSHMGIRQENDMGMLTVLRRDSGYPGGGQSSLRAMENGVRLSIA
jgi:hypothetical protein